MFSTAASSSSTSRVGSAARAIFATILFVAWVVGTIVWVVSMANHAADGHPSAAIVAIAAILLLILLAGMEGLEIAVTDRWDALWPDGNKSHLAAWLAARQLFVALIVTTATQLAEPPSLIVPFTSVKLHSKLGLKVFDLLWLGLTILWFAQILPKHMAAINADRYLRHLRGVLFPVVEVVNKSGVTLPGKRSAMVVEHSLSWHPTEGEVQEAAGHDTSLGAAWRELIPEEQGRTPGPRELSHGLAGGESPE
jgi:hypothetical protein